MDLKAKTEILQKLIERLESDRESLMQAARNTYEAATHEESEAEDQYDTRGLEASYLAGAQAKRVGDLEQMILQYRFLRIEGFQPTDAIRTTALVELQNDSSKTIYCFLLPSGGGVSLQHAGKTIQIISPQSPLGEVLMGRHAGEDAVVETGAAIKEYEIISVC